MPFRNHTEDTFTLKEKANVPNNSIILCLTTLKIYNFRKTGSVFLKNNKTSVPPDPMHLRLALPGHFIMFYQDILSFNFVSARIFDWFKGKVRIFIPQGSVQELDRFLKAREDNLKNQTGSSYGIKRYV